MKSALRLAALVAIVAHLAACGGGGGNSLASTPAPQPSTQPPPPVVKTNFGVTQDTEFATVGEDVQFRWIESAKAYEIQFPGQPLERLVQLGFGPVREEHYPSSGVYFISLSKDLPYQYTNLATQLDNAWGGFLSEFAYGIPTAAGDVPVTGSASYTARIFGGSYYPLSGDAHLTFSFGAGSLTGFMHPFAETGMGPYDLGRYDFTQTVYSTGSTTFSGKFVVPGGGSTADSGFSGLFTGPQAAELMTEFHAPFMDPNSNQWRNMTGLWIGKKD
jgi:hypothetical protein